MRKEHQITYIQTTVWKSLKRLLLKVAELV